MGTILHVSSNIYSVVLSCMKELNMLITSTEKIFDKRIETHFCWIVVLLQNG